MSAAISKNYQRPLEKRNARTSHADDHLFRYEIYNTISTAFTE
jgi:hypothetical protein